MNRFEPGDRVITPDGPGTYVNTYRGRDIYELSDWREFLIVQLDPDPKGTIWRRVYSGDQVAPLRSISEYIEQEEAKKGEP